MLNYVSLQLQLLIDPMLLTWHLKGTSYIKIIGGSALGITLTWANNLDEFSLLIWLSLKAFGFILET